MSFKRQLQQRLPHWIEQGWVSADNAAHILNDAAAGERHGPRYLALISVCPDAFQRQLGTLSECLGSPGLTIPLL